MDISNFVHPLEMVQVRSVLSYVVLLSDFLLKEQVLNITDLNKPIPAVNAMYKYLVEPNSESELPTVIDTIKLKNMTTYLIRNSDLYGSENGEKLDPHFIQLLFNHIINSLVFNKYGNVYGFIAEVVRTSNCRTDEEIRESLWVQLVKESFENKDGSYSQLDQHSCVNIFQDYIVPSFPKMKTKSSIFSIDYAYAQAGSMFFRSLLNTGSYPTTQSVPLRQIYIESNHSAEYIKVAHIVVQLVTTGEIDYSALRIFAVPALLYYVHDKKEDLQNKTIVNIINNHTEWQTAFKHFFSKLSDFFQTVDEAQNKNYKYAFFNAINTYENRSSLARSNLKRNCPELSEKVMENEIWIYLNCTQDCFCINNKKMVNLTSVDTLFKKQFNNTVEKYAAYERESIKMVFSDEIKQLMSNQKVEIRKGLFENQFIADVGPTNNNAKEMQSVPEKHDILEFYFPETDRSAYYGLIRKDFEVSLINETFDEQFKEKLGLYSNTYFVNWKFKILLKGLHENFDDFLTNITKERVKIFRRDLKFYRNKQEEQPWWKEFLLSSIPFYTCSQAIKEGNVDLAEMACSMDIAVLIPGALEVSMALKEVSVSISKSSMKIALTSIEAASSKVLLQAAIRSGSRILVEGGMRFIESLTPQLFKKVGIAVLRMVDPGFELLYSLGKGGVQSIGKLVYLLEHNYPGTFALMEDSLKNAMNRMTSFTKKIPQRVNVKLFENNQVFVQSLEKNSGYGYKFIHLNKEKIATLRSVKEFPGKVPILSSGSDINGEIYTSIYKHKTKKIDEMFEIDGISKIDKSIVYEIKPMIVHLVHDRELKLTEREFKVGIKTGPLFCTGGRLRRSPDGPCSRKILLEERDARVKEAVEFGTKNPVKRFQIKKELNKYLFLEGSEKKELDFIKDWKDNNFLTVPEWSDDYKIELPKVYNELRYNKELSKKKNLKSAEDRDMYEDYKRRGLREHVTFRDYKNIYSYVEEYSYSLTIPREVQDSLYRLAIRQSDDIIMDYDKKLYLIETRPTKTIDKLFLPIGKEFEFDRFTSTTTNDYYADMYSVPFQEKTETKVLYEMYLPETYLRAKLEIFTGDINKEETVLLPGSKFEITGVEKETRRGGAKSVTVKMTYKHNSKLQDIRSVMKKLQESKYLDKHPEI